MRTEQKTNVKNSIGRLIFVLLSILLQAGWLTLLVMRLNAYSTYITLFSSILAVVVVLKIYGKSTNAAFKMPWIIILLALPVLGLCIYVMFGRSGASKRVKKKFLGTEEKISREVKQDESIIKELEEKDPHMANQCRYLWNMGRFPVYKNTDIVYYKDAAEGFEAQLQAISKAKKFIFMEYHAIEEAEAFQRLKNALVKKAKEGVDIRIFYDDMGSIGFIDKSFVKRMEAEGIKCCVFNPIMPIFDLFMNNRDHRKITVIDNRVGFTGGYNLADEYFNITHPYGRWKDTGIRLEGDAVEELTRIFLSMWNAINKLDEDCNDYLIPYDDYKAESNGFVQPYADSPLDGENVGENVYINLIQYAKKKLYITTPYLIISDEMNRALTLAAKKGVDVRIVTPGIPDKKVVYKVTRSYYAGLARYGVRIYEYTPGFMHAKQFIVDDVAATVGTINMDYRSLYHHFENGVLFYDCDAIKDIAADFEDIFKDSEEVTEKYGAKKSSILRLGQCILRLAAPLL